ncbi:MAG: hypothetical protein QF464_09375 [Myxococcota bacterium]|nr:hypothetical protein [Myxococcota bacterium]
MSPPRDKDQSTWQIALATLGAPEALDRIRLVGDRGVKHRSLVVRADTTGVWRAAWLAGGREPMRAGLQQLLEETLGVQHRWLLRWLQGRWPRGPLTVRLPLVESLDGIALGIVAPLSPTRVALSEGPLPFDKASVAHFKALHAATGAQGLSGCRLVFADRAVTDVGIRWRLDHTGLAAGTAEAGLADAFQAHVLPVLEGLGDGLAEIPVTLEASYSPAPPTELAIEMGPVPTGRVIGLMGALWGDQARQALTEAAKALGQRWTHRVRLEFGAQGIETTAALLTTSDVNKADW